MSVVPKRGKFKKVTFDPSNYANTTMAGVVYRGGKYPIKKQKQVIKVTPKKIETKTVDYGPINYYGKQTKTSTKSKYKR